MYAFMESGREMGDMFIKKENLWLGSQTFFRFGAI